MVQRRTRHALEADGPSWRLHGGVGVILLELYQRRDYSFNRIKGNIDIGDSHLSIVGCAADSLFATLHSDQIESGLLPRFGIIMPERKPDYMVLGGDRP